MSVAAFLDASVLYPATLRSVLMYLAAADGFHALWSDAVSAEWMAALARNRPDLSPAAIVRARALMEAHVEHAVHVLAAVIHGGANMIGQHQAFPAGGSRALQHHGAGAGRICPKPARRRNRSRHRRLCRGPRPPLHPPMNQTEYSASLERAGLSQTAAALRAFAEAL